MGRYLQLKKNFFAMWIVPGGIFHKEKITPELLEAYANPFPTDVSRVGTWVFPGEIRRSARWLAEIESKLPQLKDKPAAMIWPRKDPAFGKRKHLNRWLSYFPKAEVEELEDASHYLQEDRPDRVVAGIKKVMERIH